jgi:hypothetical protein
MVAAASIGWSVWKWHRDQRARDALMSFAIAKGWGYQPTDPSLLHRWFLEPFGRGEQQRVLHVIQGHHAGREFVAFEYHFKVVTTTSKGHRRTRKYVYSILVVAMPGHLPTISVTPESVVDRAMRAVNNDVELESEAFNRAYVVSGPARAASDLLSPRAMATLASVTPFAWRTEGQDLVAWQAGVLSPTALLERLHALCTVLDTAPSFLWRTEDGPPASGVDRRDTGLPDGMPGSVP